MFDTGTGNRVQVHLLFNRVLVAPWIPHHFFRAFFRSSSIITPFSLLRHLCIFLCICVPHTVLRERNCNERRVRTSITNIHPAVEDTEIVFKAQHLKTFDHQHSTTCGR
ncbi:hypothetical protein MRB53_024522 [Persea americana]|uniref:Uncharacterized protein n=1 Tax=Persea americana TaxID=3435 RepID=A0ACC2LDT7_PERAE|nr:hypothetical protein MRB53_024522 [Persea americana]